jgi:hypothetical protein
MTQPEQAGAPIECDPDEEKLIARLLLITNVLVVRSMVVLGEPIDQSTITPRTHGPEMVAYVGQLTRHNPAQRDVF